MDAGPERVFVAPAAQFSRSRPASPVQHPRPAQPEQFDMLHVALWEPEIPPNTGNVARLCAATGTRLHLIGRLGFRLDNRHLKRAGLDYWPAVDLVQHVTFEEFEEGWKSPPRAVGGLWCVETPGELPYTRATFRDGDCLLFG